MEVATKVIGGLTKKRGKECTLTTTGMFTKVSSGMDLNMARVTIDTILGISMKETII